MRQAEDSSLHGGSSLWQAIQEIRADHKEQQAAMNDLQRQIDLQRLATNDLIGGSQSSKSSPSALDQFQEVALSTAAAAQQLEAEILHVRSCCDSSQKAVAKEINAFRSELEEISTRHYADITELCAGFAGKAGPPQQTVQIGTVQGELGKHEISNMFDTRDRNIRDQMSQLLETTQAALSKNFLEEHRKVLVEVLEEREMRIHETQQLRSRLETVIAAVQQGTVNDVKSLSSDDGSSVQLELQSMREAIKELRATTGDDARGAPLSKPMNVSPGDAFSESAETMKGSSYGTSPSAATERYFFDELAKLRTDIASCLDAANAAVRLGEHLTNELHIEVEARSSDVNALRAWVGKVFDVLPGMGSIGDGDDDLPPDMVPFPTRTLAGGSSTQSQINIADLTGVLDKTRFALSHSPFVASRDSVASVKLAKSRGDSTQHSLVSAAVGGSQNIPMGVEISGLGSPGLMLSAGTLLQHTMPAGDRYLASQRRAQLTPGSGIGHATGGGASVALGIGASGPMSPRQSRMQSPLRNFLSVQRPASVSHHQVRRQQSASPLRDNRECLAQGLSLQASSAQLGVGFPSSTSVAPGTARRMDSVGQLARSASPVQRRISMA
jgi:hypothetical protein